MELNLAGKSVIAAADPLRRGGRPDDIASAVVCLAAAGSVIPGQTLSVSGGCTMA